MNDRIVVWNVENTSRVHRIWINIYDRFMEKKNQNMILISKKITPNIIQMMMMMMMKKDNQTMGTLVHWILQNFNMRAMNVVDVFDLSARSPLIVRYIRMTDRTSVGCATDRKLFWPR